MTNQHPIIPPSALIEQWRTEASVDASEPFAAGLSTRAAQWGADAELDACCECMAQWYRAQSFLKLDGDDPVPLLRAARRPKPPSLKEQALKALDEALFMADDVPPEGICSDQARIIRRALESLPE